MLKPAPLGIKPKDAGTDMIKFVRQHYISSNGDRADVRLSNCAGERPDGCKVLKRCIKTYATELSPDWWDKRYRRTQYNFTCGAFSLPQYPYKSLGEVILDPNELVIDALSGSLPANFKRMYKKTDKERQTEKATSWANVAAKESKAKNLMGAGLYLSRQMEFNTAGMKQLKALLRESSLRIIATRGAQSYVDHVENCSKVKKDKMREQEEAETPGMVLRKLSSQSFFENAAVPVHTEYTKTSKLGRSAARKLRKMTQNVIWIRHKLVAIYQVLSALINMKPKYLRGKQPLKIGIVKMLFRDPFAVDPLAGKAPPRQALTRQENMQRSKDSPISQADGGSAAGESTARTGKDSSQSHRQSMSTQSSFHLQQQVSGVNPLPGRVLFERINGIPAKVSGTRRKTRTKVHPNQYEDGSVRLEGWEDLLNLGVKNKQLRVQKPKQPPWQMLANMYDDGEISMKKSAASRRDGNLIVNEDAEKVVSRAQQNFMNMKKKIYKNISHEIERLDRQRLTKYQYKMHILDTLLPLFVDQQQLLSDVGHSAAMENVHLEKATKWFSCLAKEVESVTHSGLNHALSFEDSMDLNKSLKRLENFRKDEITLIPNVKEKLCLLTLSIPAYELCTQYMQNAIKFVLEEILHANVSLLNDWLDYRGLPHFYT